MVEGRTTAAPAGSDYVAPASSAPAGDSSGGLNLVDISGQGGDAPQGAFTGQARRRTLGYALNEPAETAGTTPGGKGNDDFVITPMDYTQYGPGVRDFIPGTTQQGDGTQQPTEPITGKWSDATKQKEITDAIDKLVETGVIGKPVKDVKVEFTNFNGDQPDPNQVADFIVKKDGTVVVNNNPNRKPEDPVTVQVERDKGQTDLPNEEQQKAIDGLVKYIADTHMTKTPEGKLDGKIIDDQGLVTEKTKQSIAPDVVPSDLPAPTRQQNEAVNRWGGNGDGGGGGGRGGGDGGTLSPRQQGEYFPQRDVPRQADESDRLVAMKDVVAGLATRGSKEPYYHVENRGERGFAVGRYGTTSEQISGFFDWLSGLSEEQIEELIKKGVLPKNIRDTMKKMKSPEGQRFLEQLKEGKQAPGKEQIDEFFGKETQEAAGSYLVTKMANATRNEDGSENVGKIALGLHLGRVPSEEDLANPEYQKVMQTAEKTFPVAIQRVLDGTRDIDLSDKAKAIASVADAQQGNALWTKYASETQNGNLGCAAAVSEVLRKAQAVPGNFNELAVYYMDQKLQSMGWEKVDYNNRRPGDVIIGYRTSNPAASMGGGAHTGIVGENGKTYSNSSSTGEWTYNDPNSWVPPNGGYQITYVLRPPGS